MCREAGADADGSLRRWPIHIGIILRRLASVEHAVVAHHANAAKPRAILQCDRTLEDFSGGLVTPGHEQDDVAGHQNSVEHVPSNEPLGRWIEAQPFGNMLWRGLLDPSGRPRGVDQGYRRGVARLRLVQPLFLQRMAVRQPGVPRQLADPQVIVEKDLEAPLLLGLVMLRPGAPADQCLLVTPT